jgi:hypothetical protein
MAAFVFPYLIGSPTSSAINLMETNPFKVSEVQRFVEKNLISTSEDS